MIKGLITGSRMNQSDFTIEEPIVNFVLHDPPGDGSSATLKKGAKSVTTTSWRTSAGATNTIVTQKGVHYTQDMILTVFGAGTSMKVLDATVTAGVDINGQILGTYNGSTIKETETTTDISTSSSDKIVGKKADLFVGSGYLITVGSGDTLSYDTSTCSVNLSTNTQVADNKINNHFTHSYYDIQKNMIPKLLEVHKNETNSKKKESYVNSINKWIDVLLRNDYVLNDYKKSDYAYMANYPFLADKYNSLPATLNINNYNWANYPVFTNINKNRSFDGGGATFTENVLESNTRNHGGSVQTVTDIGSKTIVKGTTGIASGEFETRIIANLIVESGSDTGTTDDTVVQYTLSDDDAGDRFAIEIKKDPNYTFPIFKTLAGQSMCPAERGTQLRNGVEIVAVDPIIANGLTSDVLKYKIKLRNTQKAIDRIGRSYKFELNPASNPLGAIVKINGALVNNGSSVPIWYDPDPSSPSGVKQEVDATIEISVPPSVQSSNIKYEKLDFWYYIGCESHEDVSFDHNQNVYDEAGIKSFDQIFLTAEFHGPCVANLNMQEPQNNWVVNESNLNKQNFVFTIPGVTVLNGVVSLPESLTSVDIEYALRGNNTPSLLKKITVAELKAAYSENAFKISVDVAGLANGEYGFRLVPVCGLGTEVWRKNVPTAFAYGLISRDAPKLVSTNPAEGGVLKDGSITATYDKALDTRTLTSSNIALRGILGGMPKKLISVDFKNKTNQITIPHGKFLNLSTAFTIEFWINPASYPITGFTNILNKGSNYGIFLQADGKLNYRNGAAGGNTVKSDSTS